MDVLNIVSAGAAQAVVARLAARLQQPGGCTVNARYGAVQTMKACVLAGEACDLVVLTDALIDELVGSGWVLPGTRVDLGSVGTAVAVRSGEPRPDVATPEALRRALLAAPRIVCPDPASATAGKVLLRVLGELGITAEVQPRLVYCRSGYEAMAELARGRDAGELGVMQITEVIAGEIDGHGVALAGPLPPALQSAAIYSIAVAARSTSPQRARAFIAALLADGAALEAAGFAAVLQPEPATTAGSAAPTPPGSAPPLSPASSSPSSPSPSSPLPAVV